MICQARCSLAKGKNICPSTFGSVTETLKSLSESTWLNILFWYGTVSVGYGLDVEFADFTVKGLLRLLSQ